MKSVLVLIAILVFGTFISEGYRAPVESGNVDNSKEQGNAGHREDDRNHDDKSRDKFHKSGGKSRSKREFCILILFFKVRKKVLLIS